MRQSSESVAALATALAKAQAELVNPEKSLTATIRGTRPGEPERQFRYAPLSSGLDIVRKTLGQHEIATVQTTAIDTAAGMVNLTTTLAHASGEWIASDWPVCPVAETANPQRMGSALTYARRYALFTLVGIAGEDDVDAPDLDARTAPPVLHHPTLAGGKDRGSNRRGSVSSHSAPLPPLLGVTESAKLRDGMLGEIPSITSAEGAHAWAKSMLGTKNRLRADDARSVEDAFAAKCTKFVPSPEPTEPLSPEATPLLPPSEVDSTPAPCKPGAPRPMTKTLRRRDKNHLKFVAAQACLVCGKQPSDPHHLRFAQPLALGRKVSDEYTVPLCRAHHREVHRSTKEITWWQALGIAPLAAAEALWRQTRSGGSALEDHFPRESQQGSFVRADSACQTTGSAVAGNRASRDDVG